MSTPPRDHHIPDLVSLTEAAEILGVSRAAVHKMATKGQLRGAQVGVTWVFRRIVVERQRPAETNQTSRWAGLTAEKITTITALYREGVLIREIANQVNWPKKRVEETLRQLRKEDVIQGYRQRT